MPFDTVSLCHLSYRCRSLKPVLSSAHVRSAAIVTCDRMAVTVALQQESQCRLQPQIFSFQRDEWVMRRTASPHSSLRSSRQKPRGREGDTFGGHLV